MPEQMSTAGIGDIKESIIQAKQEVEAPVKVSKKEPKVEIKKTIKKKGKKKK